MLPQQLRDLGDCGMAHREVIPKKPPKTIYSMTTFGESILPVLLSISRAETVLDDCKTRSNSGFPAKLTPSPILFSQNDARSDHLLKSL